LESGIVGTGARKAGGQHTFVEYTRSWESSRTRLVAWS
jgi:hypothetical protein